MLSGRVRPAAVHHNLASIGAGCKEDFEFHEFGTDAADFC